MAAFLREAPALLGHDAHEHAPPVAPRRRRATSSGTTPPPWARSSTRCARCTTRSSPAAVRSTWSATVARGKMLVRERLEALVDPGTPVLELCPLAGLHTGDPVGGGVVVALAEVAHTQCLVIANDPTVRGGTTSPTTIRKLLRAMDVAEENRLPLAAPGGVRRGRPAPPGRRLRARRRAVPPPDPALGAGHPHRLRRVRLLHRRRRLPPRHERLHGHGRGPGPRLPRRAAARQDGHRRGGRRGGAGRGAHARRDLGPVRLPGP